jgi:hypothetical protein
VTVLYKARDLGRITDDLVRWKMVLLPEGAQCAPNAAPFWSRCLTVTFWEARMREAVRLKIDPVRILGAGEMRRWCAKRSLPVRDFMGDKQ